MTITGVSDGCVLVYLTQQELELLQECLNDTLESTSDYSVKDRIGSDHEEVRSLMRQVGDGIEMIKRGSESAGFGQLRSKEL